MPQQGSCAGQEPANVIMDRLAGLSKVIPPEAIEQALAESGRDRQKACPLSHRAMLWLTLAMGLVTHLPIRQVFKFAQPMIGYRPTPSRSNLCEGRRRLGVEPLQSLFRQVVRPLATPETPGAFYHGLRLMSIDGTVLDAPDTDANAERFDRARGGRGEGAFPQVRKMSLVEIGTHIEVAFAMGGWQDSEQTLAEQLWDQVPEDALLIEDRGLFSYKHWKALQSRGVQLLIRVKSNMVFQPIRRLADGSYEAKIYPSSDARKRDQGGILVRVIDYTLNDPQRVGHGEEHRLITTLLDIERHPAKDLVCLYHERWEAELVYDEQKTHLDPRRAGKSAYFRSGTPVGVEQEVYAVSLGHFVIRALMLEAAKTENLDVDRLSFTGCFRILQIRLPECLSWHGKQLEQWYQRLLREMAEEKIEPRRNRVNPRVVKRKMSKFKKKRPEHRGQPPLQKPFAESVVIT